MPSTTTEQVCWHNEDDNGFHLTEFKATDGRIGKLNIITRAALACNDVCSKNGYGRIYVIFAADIAQNVTSTEKMIALYRLTKLFYVPEIWTQAEQDEWKSRGWESQLSRICVGNGWLDSVPHMPVLPIRLEVQKTRRHNPRFEGLSLATVLVYFAPQPYVAPIRDIEALGELCLKGRSQNSWVYHVEGWDCLQQWKCESGVAVLEALDRQYWAGGEEGGETVVWLGSLMERLKQVTVCEQDLTSAMSSFGTDDPGSAADDDQHDEHESEQDESA